MGSTNDSEFIPGDQPAEHAYRTAIDEALREHGHDGYNGTISTSGGFHVVTNTPVTWAEAHALEEERLENLSKWGDWEAIPIARDDAFTDRTLTKTFRLDVPTLPWGEDLRRAVAPHLKLKDGEILGEVKVTANEAVWKPVVTTPEGERKVVYFIEGTSPFAPNEFDSIAEARARLVEMAKGWDKANPLEARVKGKVTRGSNKGDIPLLVVRTDIRSRKVTVEAVARKSKGSTPGVQGWYFYGWAAI